MMNGRVVRSRSKESALARTGWLPSRAAPNVRRTPPVPARCRPPSCLTRAARPPPRPSPRRGAPLRWRAGGGARRARGASSPPAQRTRPRRPRAPHPPAHPAVPPCRPPGHAAPAACPPDHHASRRPPRTRTGSRSPPPRPSRAGTRRTPPRPRCPRCPRHPRGRSFARLQVVRRRDRHRPRCGMRLQRWPHVAVHDGARVSHAQLLEQERERPLEVGADRAAHVFGKIPQPPLERSDRLLAALVDELLLGIALLPLVLALGLHPLVELGPQTGGEPRVVKYEGLKVRREMNLDRFAGPEVPECFPREGGGPLLGRTPPARHPARPARERPHRLHGRLA